MAMASYQIRYLGPDGAVVAEERQVFPDDDAAIDAAGASGHPHEILLSQGDRIVARFPPWPRPTEPLWPRRSG